MKPAPLSSLRIILLLASCASGLVLAAYSISWMPRVTHGFTMYYTYARMILEGEDFGKIYDVDYFDAKVRAYGMATKDVPNNIPTNALALLAFAWLSPESAKICWTLTSLLAIILSIRIILQAYKIRITENLGLGLITLCFVWGPLYENMAFGQLYAVILLLFSMSLLGIIRGNSTLSALPVSAAFIVKGYGIVPAVWMATKKRWTSVLVTLMAIAFVIAITLPLFGMEAWAAFYAMVVSTIGVSASQSHVAYQTVHGFVHHLFSYDQQWSPLPLIDLPRPMTIGLSLGLCVSIIWLTLRWMKTGGTNELLLSYSASIAVSVVAAPAAEEYHYVLFLPLVLGLIATRVRRYVLQQQVEMVDVVLAAAILLIALPLRYKGLQLESFPMIIVAYPRLFGGLVVLLLTPRIASSPEEHTSSTLLL